MRTLILTSLFVGLPFLPGCGSYEPANAPVDPGANQPSTGATGSTDAPAGTNAQPAAAGDDAASQPQPPQPPTAAPANQTAAQTPPDANRKKAEVGVGIKGQGYGGGIITEPIRARFRIADRINFDAIKHDMDLFKALHDRAPKSHEEFMKEIIKAGQRELPELPAGEKYLYDPKDEELWIYPDPIK